MQRILRSLPAISSLRTAPFRMQWVPTFTAT